MSRRTTAGKYIVLKTGEAPTLMNIYVTWEKAKMSVVDTIF